MGQCIAKERCPRCAASGNDATGDNLVIYDNGGGFCFACGYTVGDKGITSRKEAGETVMPEFALETIFVDRGTSPEALKAYGVKLLQDSESGELYVNFPIPDVNGASIYNQKRYYNPATGQLSREMKFDKGSKLTNPLFGWSLINKNTKTLLLCEGNTDTLAAASRLQHKSDTVVLGLVGASMAKRAAAQIIRHAPNVDVVLALDNDDAGRKATDDFVDYYRTNSDRPLTQLRFDFKDVCDWLRALPETNLVEAIANAEAVLSSDIVGASEITKSFISYLDAIEKDKYVTLRFSPTLSNALRLMPGKLVGVAGDSGKGKSTLVEQIALEALADGKNVFMISAEMKPAEVALKMVRNARGINYYDKEVLRGLSAAERQSLHEFTMLLLKRLKMFARFGNCGVDEIEEKIHELVAANVAPDLIIIDHILAIASEGSTEQLEHIAKNLKALAERHAVPIIVLSHVRKQMQQNKRTVYRPQLSDIYNSGGLGRYADVVLGVGLDPEKRLTMVETIKLERMGGGYCDLMLQLNEWSLQEVDENATNALPLKDIEDDEGGELF
jgi:archaellum biogenesis ATPase FlaH